MFVLDWWNEVNSGSNIYFCYSPVTTIHFENPRKANNRSPDLGRKISSCIRGFCPALLIYSHLLSVSNNQHLEGSSYPDAWRCPEIAQSNNFIYFPTNCQFWIKKFPAWRTYVSSHRGGWYHSPKALSLYSKLAWLASALTHRAWGLAN